MFHQHKPCPFCGRPPELYSAKLYASGYCHAAGCRECEFTLPWMDTAEEAWKQWDRRYYDMCEECGRVKIGLLCSRQYFDFITGELMRG